MEKPFVYFIKRLNDFGFADTFFSEKGVELQDSVCPLCQEEEDTTAHFIAQCSALMLLRNNIHLSSLLKLKFCYAKEIN